MASRLRHRSTPAPTGAPQHRVREEDVPLNCNLLRRWPIHDRSSPRLPDDGSRVILRADREPAKGLITKQEAEHDRSVRE